MISSSMFRASPRRQSGKQSEPGDVHLSVATSGKKDGDHKPRNKDVNFRYRSPAASPPPEAATPTRRFPSPNFGRTPNVQESPKRATSAERRQPVGSPARASNNTLAAALGSKRLWPSSLSISSSMQSDTSSLSSSSLGSGRFGSLKDKHERLAPDHTLKPAGNGVRRSTEQSPGRKSTPEKKPTSDSKHTSERRDSPERKDSPRRKATTPERKRTPVRRASFDQGENARPLEMNHYRPDVQRWPGATAKLPAFSNTAESSKEKQKLLAEASTFLPQVRSIITVSGSTPMRSSVSSPPGEELVQPTSRIVSRKLVLESRRREESDSREEKSSDRCKEASDKDKNSNSTFKQYRHSTDKAELASIDSFPAHPDVISDSDSVSSGSSGAIATSGLGSITPASGNKAPLGGRSGQEQGKGRRLFEGNRRRSSLSESDFLSAISGKSLRKTQVASVGPPSSPDTVGNGAGSPFTAWASSARRSVSISLSNCQAPAVPTVPTKPTQSSSPSSRFPSPTKPRGATTPTRLHRVGIALLGSLSFRSELVKGRQTTGQYDEALSLRILHNRLLQWRFVNASTEAAMNAQSAAAEKLIYNAWIQTADLQASVFMNTIQLQQARQASKLDSLISSHGQQLEECESLQQEHSTILFGVREALSATILKVPVLSGARADVQAIREAFGSVLDIMNSLDLLVRRLEPKSGRTSSLTYELTEMASQEISSLHECASLLEKLAELEMEERSLKSHSIQLDLSKIHRPTMDSYVDMR